jgi:hypothetical protein
VGFDVDGVLADFRSAFHSAAMKCLRRDILEPSDSDQVPGALDADDVRRVWDYIGRTQNWWMDVPAYEPDQIARLYALTRAAGWEVFFLTKRPPSAGDSVQFQTQWWIERFGFYLPAVLTVPGSRGDVANGLRLDLIVDDQIINCVEVISGAQTKALLMQRLPDAAAKEHASNRGIGVVSSMLEALTVIERLHDVLPQKRGRLLRLSDWFASEESHTLPENPRTIRPIPPFDPRR